MKADDFCKWLDGYVDAIGKGKLPTKEQFEIVKKKLASVSESKPPKKTLPNEPPPGWITNGNDSNPLIRC